MKPYTFIIATAVSLFVLNNIILGAIVTRLPGGSAAGITTMFAITLASLVSRKPWAAVITYAIYGLIGLPSHLWAGDWHYLASISLVVAAGLAFDLAVLVGKRKEWSYLAGLLLLDAVLYKTVPLLALLMGLAGMVLALLVCKKTKIRRLTSH